MTTTENTVLDRKGVWTLNSSARLVAVDVHVLHNLVRQLSKNLMEMVMWMVMGMIVFMTLVTLRSVLKFMGFCLGVRGGEVVVRQGAICYLGPTGKQLTLTFFPLDFVRDGAPGV